MTDTFANEVNHDTLSKLAVTFRVLNDKHEEKIYLENKPSNGLLEIENKSKGAIFFIPGDPEKDAGPDNFHFALKFRPGILKAIIKNFPKNKIITKGWTYSVAFFSFQTNLQVVDEKLSEEEVYPILYFLNTSNIDWEGSKLLLPLKHLDLDCDEGTQVTKVELICNNLNSDKDLSKEGRYDQFTRHFNLTIVNHRGNPHMPLHIGFAGHCFNTILNDGTLNPPLTLRITNLQKRTSENDGTFRLSHRKHSKIYLYFSTDRESSDHALGTPNSVAGIGMEFIVPRQSKENYELDHEPMLQGNIPIWEIFPKRGDIVLQPHLTNLPIKKISPGTSSQQNLEGSLPDDSCLDIKLTGIKTDFLMGTAFAYLRFENIPGFWDHTYSIPIIKQSLVFRRYDNEDRIGIGTSKPTKKLELKGSMKFSNDSPGADDGVIGVTEEGLTITGIDDKNRAGRKIRIKGNVETDGNIKFKDNGEISSLDANHKLLFRRTENKMELREFGDIIFSPGSGGTETAKVIMKASGQVEINGNIKFKDYGEISSADQNHRILFRRGENKLELREYGDIIFSPGATNGTETSKVIIKQDGKVGVGTNAPLGPLSVGDSSKPDSDGFIVIGKRNGGTGTRHFKIGLDENFRFKIGDFGNNNTASTWRSQFAIAWEAPDNSFVLARNGNLGIGTNDPSQAKLVVSGNASYSVKSLLRIGRDILPLPNINAPISIYSSDGIVCKEILHTSDERIKDIKFRSESSSDLKRLLGIEITDYTYKDKIGKGDRFHKKVIAQQVQKVFPTAVSKISGAIPDIYQTSSIKKGWVALSTTLKPGEHVQLIFGTEKKIVNVLGVDKDRFKVDASEEGEVFVYGRQVDDLLSVDYTAISMLNVSATQELAKRFEELKVESRKSKIENRKLKNEFERIKVENGKLKNELDEMKKQMKQMMRMMKRREALVEI